MKMAAISEAMVAPKRPGKDSSQTSNHPDTSSNGGGDAAAKRSFIYTGVKRYTGRFLAHLWNKTSFTSLQHTKKERQATYDTEEAAARAYETRALIHSGPEATCNFSEDESSLPVLAAKLNDEFESEPGENNHVNLTATGHVISNPPVSRSNQKRSLGGNDAKTPNGAALKREIKEHVATCPACRGVPPEPVLCVQLCDDSQVVPSTKRHIIIDHNETNQEASINCMPSDPFCKFVKCPPCQSGLVSHSPPGVPSYVTQVFVDFCGSTMSIQGNMNKLTVEELTETVCGRAGVNSNDIYLTLSRKVLEPEQLLSHYHIQKDATIKVNHRVRGGRPRRIQFKTWDDIIQNQPRYDTVNLSPDLVHTTKQSTSAVFLSQYLQYHARHVLIALCREHVQGVSFGGNFTSSQILFNNGIAKFDDEIVWVKYGHDSAKLDYRQIHDIFYSAFWDRSMPIHVTHLLNFLWDLPVGADPKCEAVVAFLTNHPALLCYMKRCSINDLLNILVCNLSVTAKQNFPYFTKRIKWMKLIMNVPAMKKVLHFHAIKGVFGNVKVPYSDNGAGCLEFSRNYTSHASSPLRELDAAFSLAMEPIQFLPELLKNIALRFSNKKQACSKELKDFMESYIDLLGRNTIGVEDHI